MIETILGKSISSYVQGRDEITITFVDRVKAHIKATPMVTLRGEGGVIVCEAYLRLTVEESETH